MIFQKLPKSLEKIQLILPFQSEDDGHVDGRAEREVDHGKDDVRIEPGVHHRSHVEGPDEGVLGHHEDAEDGVDDGQDNDQRIETVSHFFPEKSKKRIKPISYSQYFYRI